MGWRSLAGSLCWRWAHTGLRVRRLLRIIRWTLWRRRRASRLLSHWIHGGLLRISRHLTARKIDGRPVVTVMKHEFLADKLALGLKEAARTQDVLRLRCYRDTIGRDPSIVLTSSIMNQPQRRIDGGVWSWRFGSSQTVTTSAMGCDGLVWRMESAAMDVHLHGL